MNCPYCKSAATFQFYSANMPSVMSACPPEMLPRVKNHPFTASLCRDCLLGFNTNWLSESELRDMYDHYLSISPNRGIGQTKFDGMVATLKKTFYPKDRIVEIGCADGYMLDQLRRLGYENLTGIEPGPQGQEAAARGLKVIRSYFDSSVFPEQSIDGFCLMHTFEHLTDPFAALRAMKRCLSRNGSIVIEVPNFDVFHHEHLYFYSASFMRKLAREQELKIAGLELDPFLRIVLAPRDDPRPEAGLAGEDVPGLALQRQEFFKATIRSLNQLMDRYTGKTVYWWGAGSQTVLYLNQLDLKTVQLEIVDGDEKKCGSFIPGVNLPVKSCRTLAGRTVDCLVIASMFQTEIRETMHTIGLRAEHVEELSQ